MAKDAVDKSVSDNDFNFIMSAYESGPDYAATHSGYTPDNSVLAKNVQSYLAARKELFKTLEKLAGSKNFKKVCEKGGTEDFDVLPEQTVDFDDF